MTVFVDTGPFIAFDDPRDQHHSSAVDVFRKLGRTPLPTGIPIVAETGNRSSRLIGAFPAAGLIRRILSNPHYTVLEAGRDVCLEAAELLIKYADQGVSLTDCTSIVFMRALRIRRIFTFDRAFRNLGFQVMP